MKTVLDFLNEGMSEKNQRMVTHHEAIHIAKQHSTRDSEFAASGQFGAHEHNLHVPKEHHDKLHKSLTDAGFKHRQWREGADSEYHKNHTVVSVRHNEAPGTDNVTVHTNTKSPRSKELSSVKSQSPKKK